MNWKDNISVSRLSDDELDNVFRNADGPQAPAFQEEFWTEMEALLPEKKRRKAGAWMIAALFIGAGSLFATGFILTHSENKKSSEQVSNSTIDTAANYPQSAISAPNQVIKKEKFGGTETGNQSSDIASNGLGDALSNRLQQSISMGNRQNIYITPNNYAQNNEGNNDANGINASEEEIIVVTTNDKNLANEEMNSTPETQDRITETLDFLPWVVATVYSTKNYPSIPTRTERFYIGARIGVGQSLLRTSTTASNLAQSYAFDLGIFKRVGNMVLSTGIGTRMDVSQNVQHIDFVNGSVSSYLSSVQLKQIYSVELPLSMGYNIGRHTISMNVNPGIQVFFNGVETRSEPQTKSVIQREKITGEIKDSKSLTMEMGVNYQFNLQPNWYLGLGANADIIRPFNAEVYEGLNRKLPLNIQLGIRRTF